MPDQYYDSTLTGQQLDAAFLQMQNIQQTATQVQSNATAAAQSASQAASSASAASGSASQASTYAGQASEHASAASDSADAASDSARQAAASAASIEGDVEQASSSASAAAQSATQASGSASAAAQSASAAADSEDSVQQNAAAAQQAAAAASQSKSDAEAAASNAASSASTAQQAASLIEENLSAIQAAPSNAQAAQQAAAQAAASASAAEDAAERAEQIADFDPADFATSAQGTKADTAVQSVNGKTGTAITLGAADVGAATAAQGAKADTAVQSVNGAKPDSSGNVQLDLTTGTVRSVNGKDPDGSGNVQLSAGDVGAATAAQGAKADTALQPGALNGYAQTSDIPSKLPNPQALGIQLGSGGSVTSYDGSVSRTVAITPEAIGAQPAGAAAGGGKMTLIRDTGWDSCNIGQTISLPDLSGYDAIGIQVVPDVQKSATNRSQMNIFPIPASGISECMLCASEIDSGTNFAELVARRLTIYGTTLTISTLGYFLNLPGGPPSAQLCVPRTIYGIKF